MKVKIELSAQDVIDILLNHAADAHRLKIRALSLTWDVDHSCFIVAQEPNRDSTGLNWGDFSTAVREEIDALDELQKEGNSDEPNT